MPGNPTPIERRFRAYGQELAGLQWPGEGEPVLALHGWLDNAASFQPLAEPLGHPLVALDFAGHGHSEHRPRHQATPVSYTHLPSPRDYAASRMPSSA